MRIFSIADARFLKNMLSQQRKETLSAKISSKRRRDLLETIDMEQKQVEIYIAQCI